MLNFIGAVFNRRTMFRRIIFLSSVENVKNKKTELQKRKVRRTKMRTGSMRSWQKEETVELSVYQTILQGVV